MNDFTHSASEDLWSAENLYKAGEYRNCVYLCYLSAEKFLKGCIEILCIRPPEIHNLNNLASIFLHKNDKMKFILNYVNVLMKYPDARYSNNKITQQEALQVLEATKNLNSHLAFWLENYRYRT